MINRLLYFCVHWAKTMQLAMSSKKKKSSFELDMDKLNKIDDSVKWTVFGYLREIESLILSNDILLFNHTPPLIKYICLSYFYIIAFKSYSNEIFKFERNILTKIKKNREWRNAAYGGIWIPSSQNTITK